MIPLPEVVVTRKLVFEQIVRWFAHIHTRYVLKSILITCAHCKIINLSKSVCVHNETKIKNWLDLKIIGDVFFFKCDMVSFSTHFIAVAAWSQSEHQIWADFYKCNDYPITTLIVPSPNGFMVNGNRAISKIFFLFFLKSLFFLLTKDISL